MITEAKNKATQQLPVISFGLQEVSKVAIPEWLQVPTNHQLTAQVIHTLQGRARVRRAHTKERGDVRGGGRKPWKQKGTGRSRHGSSRSPLWVGGGTTFGPRSRHQHTVPVPVRMRRKALQGCLSTHALNGSLTLVKFEQEISGTKGLLASLPSEHHGLLILAGEASAFMVLRAARNIPGVKACRLANVSLLEIVTARQVWLDESALTILAQRFNF